MEIRIIIDKISGQSFVQNPELSDPHLIKMKDYVEIIEKEYNITPISLERYRNTMDAMKRIPPAYFNIFQALSAAGNLGELLIKRNIIGSEKLMQHVIEVSKDKDHHITVTDVERCCQMYDIELEMFLNPSTRFRDIMSIISSFSDSYLKTTWHANSKTIEAMRFYFGYLDKGE